MPASGIKSPENERISLQSVCGSDFLRKDVGEVAKEAIEAVKAAEEKAAQIISDTQKRAAKLLEDVARSERDELNALSKKCEKEKDFARSIGEEVDVRTFRAISHQKEFTGILRDYDKEKIVLEMEDQELLEIARADIALIRLSFDF